MKVKICSIILFFILLTGCQRTELEISKFSHEPVNIMVYEKEASYQRTLVVFHSNGVVAKMKIVDKTVFSLEDVELINSYDEVNKITYEGEVFQINGLTQSYKIQDNTYTSTLMLEYGQMDMNVLIEQENWFINAKEIVNDELDVDYFKLEKIIFEDGYKLVE